MNGRIIIAAISARPYVQAAVKAGFEVIAIDSFADEETRQVASQTYIINTHDDGLDPTELLELLALIVQPNDVLCYGAGFERQPLLLKKIAKLLPVLGNTALTIHHANTPKLFFAHLKSASLNYPEISFSGLKNPKYWIQKQAGGSGGGHITRALPLIDIPPKVNHYYQYKLEGTSVSLLFLAHSIAKLSINEADTQAASQTKDEAQIDVIGFSTQWCAPSAINPYRYGGAASHVELSRSVKNKIIQAAKTLNNILKLKGINSLDCIVVTETVWILELNARLSATFDLYENNDGDLFNAHIAACLNLPVELPVPIKHSRAHQIIYTNKGCVVPVNMDWPDYVLDRPVAGSIIEAGQPLCTVIASAGNALNAQQLVAEYAENL